MGCICEAFKNDSLQKKYKDNTENNEFNKLIDSNNTINNDINNNNNNSINNNISTNNNIKNKNIINYKNLNSYNVIYKSESNSNKELGTVSKEELLKQLKGEIETKNLGEYYKEIEIPLIEENKEDKVGCGQQSINTFCLFSSINTETYLVYSIENSMKKYLRIYALNMDTNKKTILDKNEEIYNNNIDNRNRHIPTQIRHFIIVQDEYIIAGYRDSTIYVWELVNSEFNLKLIIDEKGEPINGISLFKNKKNNEITLISSENKKSIIITTISNFFCKKILKSIGENKLFFLDVNQKDNENYVYFLDVHEKDNENYIILGLLNEVITLKYIIFDSIKHYKNNQISKIHSNVRGHECIIIYKPQKKQDEIKLIDSDTEGKCINIFNFETTELLLILNLDISKPLGINIWNSNNIIVSCLEDEENNSIKIIKVNLNKKNYNQINVDLQNINKNEDVTEAKIVYSLKIHEGGTLSSMKINNKKYGEFFVSIGIDNHLKLWKVN